MISNTKMGVLLIFALVGFSASTLAKSPRNKTLRDEKPEAGSGMAKDLLGMENDSDYFHSPFKSSNAIRDKLEEEGFEGLIIGGPSKVPANGGRFPIEAIWATDALNASIHNFQHYALITAMDLHSNELYAAYFVERRGVVDKSRDPLKNPPPPGRFTDGGAVNLFTCLGIPSRSGEYLITALLLNNTSNRLRIKVLPSKMDGDNVKVEKPPRKNGPVMGRQGRPLAAENLLSVLQDVRAPSINGDHGIAFSLAQLKSKDKGDVGTIVFYGMYSLPSLRRPAMEARPILADSTGRMLPLTLLATGSRVPIPHVLEIGIPFPKDGQAADGKSVKGFFTLKLNRSEGLTGDQTYYFRIFMGDQVSNPVELKLEGK